MKLRYEWRNLLHEISNGERLGEVIAKELHKTIYADAIKQTDILAGVKLPWHAKYPLLKRIGGYHKPLEKVEAAVQIATDTRDQIQETLTTLYKERQKRIDAVEETKKEVQVLEEKLRGLKNPTEGKTVQEIFDAKEQKKADTEKLEANLKHYRPKPQRKIISNIEIAKQQKELARPTTEMLETEDEFHKQVVNAEALEGSVEMLDIIITDYRTLLQLFTKRVAYATTLSDVLEEVNKRSK